MQLAIAVNHKRFMAISSPRRENSSDAKYGRPIRKASRRGKTGKLNKNGHRHNKG